MRTTKALKTQMIDIQVQNTAQLVHIIERELQVLV